MTPAIFFKSLADDTRFQLIMLLQQHGELCVCELTELLNLSQPKISRHLAQLRSHGILSDQRKGRWVYYRISPALPDWCQQVITAGFQGNQTLLNPLLSRQPNAQQCCE